MCSFIAHHLHYRLIVDEDFEDTEKHNFFMIYYDFGFKYFFIYTTR